jgi:predicted transposase/invertase (TIGR01784 family)
MILLQGSVAVTKLEYTFKNDTLFKSVFVKYPDLLKRLVAELLGIPLESIEELVITNPDMPPDAMGEKFCRLDINMVVDGKTVDLEIQVADEGDYPERSLYYWAREYSSTLKEGGDYIDLPRTIVISIVAFKMFDCAEFHSEFQPLEMTRHTPLTDRQVLHYFELPKLPEVVNADDVLKLWLALFNAETEEELTKIEEMGVSVMKEAIGAYRQVTATDEFKELERLRSRARHNEAAALRRAAEVEREKWQGVAAENVELRSQIAELKTRLGEGKQNTV